MMNSTSPNMCPQYLFGSNYGVSACIYPGVCTTPSIPNYSFEAPSSSACIKSPTNFTWDYTDIVAVCPNNIDNYTAGMKNAPDGNQVVVLQASQTNKVPSISKVLNLYNGGYYILSFYVAGRNASAGLYPLQIYAKANNQTIMSPNVYTNGNYVGYSSNQFYLTGSVSTASITIAGYNSDYILDNATMIDNVTISMTGFMCNGLDRNYYACSFNGQCVAPNTCVCNNGYYGANCEAYDCYGIMMNSTSVCAGAGTCVSPNKCVCNAALGDISFEANAISTNTYYYPNSACGGNMNSVYGKWTFSCRAVISNGNANAFHVPYPPMGNQVLIIQSGTSAGTEGIASQNVTLYAGVNYQVSFYAASRDSGMGPTNLVVLINGNTVFSVTPTSTTTFNIYRSSPFSVSTTGSYVFTITSNNVQSMSDASSFVDGITLTGLNLNQDCSVTQPACVNIPDSCGCNAITDSSFERQQIPTNSFYYVNTTCPGPFSNPSYGGWNYNCLSAISNGRSAFATPPPFDNQTMVIQNQIDPSSSSRNAGYVYQRVNLWTGRIYRISFYAAYRTNYGPVNLTININGVMFTSVLPNSGDVMNYYSSNLFTMNNTGAYTLSITGFPSVNVTDSGSFIDAITLDTMNINSDCSLTPSSCMNVSSSCGCMANIAYPSFETPVINANTYFYPNAPDCSGYYTKSFAGNWTLYCNAVYSNGVNAWNVPSMPHGNQILVMQINSPTTAGYAMQNIQLISGRRYVVNFYASYRALTGPSNIIVLVNNTQVFSVLPASSSVFNYYTSQPFTVNVTGTHVIAITCAFVNGSYSDVASFIDSFSISASNLNSDCSLIQQSCVGIPNSCYCNADIANPSFEVAPLLAPNTYNYPNYYCLNNSTSYVGNWTFYCYAAVINGNTIWSNPLPPIGNQMVALQYNSNNFGYMLQSIMLYGRRTYQVSFYAAGRLNFPFTKITVYLNSTLCDSI
ncbi:hypothetical protein AKO1_006009 [Acrasis kona]|uniref:EGF-like domain-containing protein n=1 Tax=Acrasis kona TaxID=1008807 RepID=A0AAW2ZMG9_9EUKA